MMRTEQQMREPVSRRTYLMVKAMEKGAHPLMAAEAVASTAIEHPEWNMDEVKTWDQWERDDG